MIEKVTLRSTDASMLLLTGDIRCEEMNPKAMLLYSAAKCAGLTALHIMEKAHMRPARLEITLSGELSTDTVQSESMYLSFHVVYNVACGQDEQVKASRAIRLTHDKHCSMMQMLRMIAPVSHEIAVVSIEPATV